jgi:hypothetical protein
MLHKKSGMSKTLVLKTYMDVTAASVVKWPEFLATDTEVPGLILLATRISEGWRDLNGVHSAS